MSPATNLDHVGKIAEAVLYEGYMLYPYRASAVKNQQRWNFGVICPRSYSESQNGTEAWMMQTQCLLDRASFSRLGVKIRFLQIVNRSIGRLTHPVYELLLNSEPEFEVVDKLEIGGRTFVAWQEAMEREVSAPPLLSSVLSPDQPWLFTFPSGREFEPLRDEKGLIAGVIIRGWETVYGSVEIGLKPCQGDVAKVTVRILNLTSDESPQQNSRADALMYSLVSAHTILTVEDGEFVSLLDPPENLRSLAAECSNIGTWPVLVGEEGQRNTMLSSPIILYDYPQIAPESPGSLFDGTEIDEILSLRILTMTDDEKHEMRQSDQRAREILERTENMPPEQFMKLHGALRGCTPKQGGAMNEWEWQLLEDKTLLDHVLIAGVEVRRGDRVQLFPHKGGDILDIALHGQTAMIEAIEQDYEGKAHVCVVLDDDPGRDLGLLRQLGHRFFFDSSEVEPIPAEKQRQKLQKDVARKPSILVAGIGNIFLGDDGFGVEVAQQLSKCDFPASVRVADFGIRGFDLAYALQDGYETTILIDAFPHGQPPGTVYVVEPDIGDPTASLAQGSFVEPHAMNPMNVLSMATAMHGPLKHVLLVGCEPATFGGNEGQMGLSPAVEAAVPEAVKVVEKLVRERLDEARSNATN